MNTNGLSKIADLLDDGSREKEVFARFGRTSYQAQVLESYMSNLILVLVHYEGRQAPQEAKVVDLETLEADLRTKTAGQVVKRLKGLLGRDRLITQCQVAIQQRNRLTHRFFADHAPDFTTSAGQQRMLDDLDEVFDSICAACEASTAMTVKLFARMGIPADVLERRVDEMLAEAQRAEASSQD